MLTGWQEINGKDYFLDYSTGEMKTGFIKDSDGKLYNLDEDSGAVKTGLVKKEDYLADGIQIAATTVIGLGVIKGGMALCAVSAGGGKVVAEEAAYWIGEATYKEVNIHGNINTELDEVDLVNRIIYEDKSAGKLYMENPDFPQTEEQWHLKKYLKKFKQN